MSEPEDTGLLTATARNALYHFRDLPRALALVWSATRGWTLAWLILLVTQGMLPVTTVYLARALVDRLSATLGDGVTWNSSRPLLTLAALLACSVLILECLRGITVWVRIAQAEHLKEHIAELIQRQCLAADLA